MRQAQLAKDIRPVSEFQGDAHALIRHVRDTRRPLILTEDGEVAAVVVEVHEYERLVEQFEILLDLQKAQSQLDAGEGVPHDEARALVLAQLGS